MNAFTYTRALQLIQDQKIIAVRVLDPTGKKLAEWKQFERPEEVAAKLDEYKNEFAAYGRINLICANETILKSNWTGAYSWNVTFDNQQSNKSEINHNSNFIPKGFVSSETATLMAQLEGLKMQIAHNQQMNEYNLKLMELNKKDPLNYLPALALVMDIPDSKLQKALQLSAIGSSMQGNKQGIAGTETKTETQKVSVQMSETELQAKLDIISNELTKLIQSVGVETVEKMIKGLNGKPDVKATVNTLMGFL